MLERKPLAQDATCQHLYFQEYASCKKVEKQLKNHDYLRIDDDNLFLVTGPGRLEQVCKKGWVNVEDALSHEAIAFTTTYFIFSFAIFLHNHQERTNAVSHV